MPLRWWANFNSTSLDRRVERRRRFSISEIRQKGALALFVILLFFGDLARNSLGAGQEIFFWGWGLGPIYINPLVKKLCYGSEEPDLWFRSQWAMSCQGPPLPLYLRGSRERIKI